MMIIGIDPGISGAICFFKDGEIVDIIDMPTNGKLMGIKFTTKLSLELKIFQKKMFTLLLNMFQLCQVKESLACLILDNLLE